MEMEIEQALLGALIYINNPIMDLKITPEYFSAQTHRDIYSEMKRLFAEKQSFSMADLSFWADKRTVGDVLISDYIRSLMDAATPSTSAILNYGEMLAELYRKRKISIAISRAESSLSEAKSSQILAQIYSDLQLDLDSKKQLTGAEVHAEIIKSMDLPPALAATGLKALDRTMAGGMYQGFTYGFAGAEKAGKTTFAHTISFNLDATGRKHLYVALEMGSKQIEQRNMARRLGINSLKFLTPDLEIRQRLSLTNPSENIIYYDAPGANLEEILHEIGIARIKHKIEGFIIDYWQLVSVPAGNRDTEERMLRSIAQGFADYARKNGLWCVLLAQANKDGNLFGGNGLRKACDQLYFIETPPDKQDFRWLRMDASRYTPRADAGSNDDPKFNLNRKVGPYIQDA